jgi:flagellar protein FlgJ
MLDQQYAMQMSGQPGGLADAIARQLERQLGVNPADAKSPTAAARATSARGSVGGGVGSGGTGATTTIKPAAVQGARATPASVSSAAAAASEASPIDRAQDFLRSHRAAAEAASSASGIPAEFMLAQAAHETGWGRREIRLPDGRSAHNFFGIKAGGDWKGPVATATTTEVIGGVAHKVTARFRAYASPAESFADYARLVGNSPRYADVVEAGGDAQAFAQGLQRAGYATDPAYADKLGRVINTTLRLAKLAT